jgi:NAD(P)H-dependent FMN reductase
MKKILAFSGSNSSVSINQRLVKAAAKLVAGIDVIDLRDYDAPIYSQDIEKGRCIKCNAGVFLN